MLHEYEQHRPTSPAVVHLVPVRILALALALCADRLDIHQILQRDWPDQCCEPSSDPSGLPSLPPGDRPLGAVGQAESNSSCHTYHRSAAGAAYASPYPPSPTITLPTPFPLPVTSPSPVPPPPLVTSDPSQPRSRTGQGRTRDRQRPWCSAAPSAALCLPSSHHGIPEGVERARRDSTPSPGRLWTSFDSRQAPSLLADTTCHYALIGSDGIQVRRPSIAPALFNHPLRQKLTGIAVDDRRDRKPSTFPTDVRSLKPWITQDPHLSTHAANHHPFRCPSLDITTIPTFINRPLS